MGVAHGVWDCVIGYGRTWVRTAGGAVGAGYGRGSRHPMILVVVSWSSGIGMMLGCGIGA